MEKKKKRICLQCRRPGFDSWVGKIPREGNGNPFQYSCLENPRDRGAWQATVHGVATVGHDLATKERKRRAMKTICSYPLPPSISVAPDNYQSLFCLYGVPYSQLNSQNKLTIM